MTENTDTIMGKRGSKIPVQIKEDKEIDSTLKNKNLTMKEKKQRNIPQHYKKTDVKQKAKQKNKSKSQKEANKLNVSNMLMKYQIQKLNLMFKYSSKCPTLTKDELYVLFAKYKSDGHYRTNQNLPPFTSLLNNMHNTINESSQFYKQFAYMENVMPRNSSDAVGNSFHQTLDEYQCADKNFKCDVLKCIDVPYESNMSNKIENKYPHTDQNFTTSNNYSHMCVNHNVQAHDNMNILSEIHNFTPSKSNLNIEKVPNTEKEYFPCNSINAQNVISEGHPNFRRMKKNIFCNIFDPNQQYENLNNLTNINEISHGNDIEFSVPCNNSPLNPNFYSDLHLNNWNNVPSITKNNSYQSLKKVQPVYTSNWESCCNMKNSAIPRQLSLIRNYPERQANFNLPISADTYSVINNKDLEHITSSDANNTQHDINTFVTNPLVVHDNVLSETNTFNPFYTNIIN